MDRKNFIYHMGVFLLIAFMFYMVRPIELDEPSKVDLNVHIITEEENVSIIEEQENSHILTRNRGNSRFTIEGCTSTIEIQEAVISACKRQSMPIEIVCGLIEVESGWRTDCESSAGCYGLCQLNPKYFPSGLTPTEQIDTAVDYIAELYVKYDGDLGAALTAYNAGHDTGSRDYANMVFEASEHYSIKEVER